MELLGFLFGLRGIPKENLYMLMTLTKDTSVEDIEIALRSGGLVIEPQIKFCNEECTDPCISAFIHAENGVIVAFYQLFINDLKTTYTLLAESIYETLQED